MRISALVIVGALWSGATFAQNGTANPLGWVQTSPLPNSPGTSAGNPLFTQGGGTGGGTSTPTSNPPGTASFAPAQVPVTATATQLAAARTGAAGTGRVDILITNTGGTTLYIGGSGVTATTGFPVAAGATATFQSMAAFFGIYATGNTGTVGVWEDY